MNKKIYAFMLLAIGLCVSCASKFESADRLPDAGQKETVRFTFSSPDDDIVSTRAYVSSGERTWKVYGFDADYNLQFAEEGTLKSGERSIDLELTSGETYRLLFAMAEKGVALPALKVGESYWTMGLYEPALPLSGPKDVLVSKGNDNGLLKLDVSDKSVRVGMLPLASRIRVESKVDGLKASSLRFANAAGNTFWAHVDNYSYGAGGIQPGNGLIPALSRTDYTASLDVNGTCYILPDLCADGKGLGAAVKVSRNGREEDIAVSLPQGMAMKTGAGKTYYVRIVESTGGTLSASWEIRSINAAKDTRITFDENEYQTQDYTLTEGVDGSALDLSANSYNRQPVNVDNMEPADMSKSFTLGVWTKTDAEVLGTKAILTNKTAFGEDKGIVLATQDNGSWMFQFTDGKNELWEYRPTARRQPLNDGNWHFLCVSFDLAKKEIRMYYDGLNVAIYSTNGNNDFNNGKNLRLGGIDGTSWNCFNGALDEFFYTAKVMTASEIEEVYSSYSGKPVDKPGLTGSVRNLKLMGFNIYHGGHELGEEVGVNRVVDVIRTANPDVVGIIETYGSGAVIADALGYYFHLRSSNLSVMSRYPIEETYDISDPFKCSAVSIRISKEQKINYINLWLNYLPSTHDQVVVNKVSVDEIVEGEWGTRAQELSDIMKGADFLIKDENTPMFVSGDFNSDSHLDWCEEARHLHYGYVLPWPTSIMMQDAGFTDSYREIHPDPVRYPCLTWSPMSKLDLQYRIDFIYYKGKNVKATDARMIDEHPIRWPSDHAAVTTDFIFE